MSSIPSIKRPGKASRRLSLLGRASRRYHLHHPAQFGLALAGVALGVAVVVAIDLANESARRAFVVATDATAGATTDQITGDSNGFDEALFARLRAGTDEIPGGAPLRRSSRTSSSSLATGGSRSGSARRRRVDLPLGPRPAAPGPRSVERGAIPRLPRGSARRRQGPHPLSDHPRCRAPQKLHRRAARARDRRQLSRCGWGARRERPDPGRHPDAGRRRRPRGAR